MCEAAHRLAVLTGADKALRLVEPVGEAPDTVDLDQAALRIQGP
jgi:hypothetical protein